MKLRLPGLALFGRIQLFFAQIVSGQVLTHRPVASGVTETNAKVFGRPAAI